MIITAPAVDRAAPGRWVGRRAGRAITIGRADLRTGSRRACRRLSRGDGRRPTLWQGQWVRSPDLLDPHRPFRALREVDNRQDAPNRNP
jgi:hypothetical protein